ncbi:interleukin-2 receptor subunit beta-like [Polypterus senegalus]|uniref:interleukin-2 receptor subunit beta-like n=1 Tax=Polypterus senegalus TaxID=55291 RepID=UPI0019659D0E|nr:interleukin-2 receptor subunit beta-like [Polypterus senegalus]
MFTQIFALLLLMFFGLSHETQDAGNTQLDCFSDFQSTITCTWNNTQKSKHTQCYLSGFWKSRENTRNCLLLPLENDDTLRQCSLVFAEPTESSFTSASIFKIQVHCENSTMAKILNFLPSKKVKMYSPIGVSVDDNGNASWAMNRSLVSDHFKTLIYELQYKSKSDSREKSKQIQDMTLMKLNPKDFVVGQLYEFRVRVKTSNYPSSWSDWSQVYEWKSKVGRADQAVNNESTFNLVLFSIFAGTGFVFILIFLGVRSQSFCHLKVPDPSKYFDPLHSLHGGNFQKWLSPMFAPESFRIDKTEAISPVEVFVKDTASLFKASSFLKLGDQWENSCQSSSGFSNMGYFFSKYPSSYEIDSCPVYFSYEPTKQENSLLDKEENHDESQERCGERKCESPTEHGPLTPHLDPDSGFGPEEGSMFSGDLPFWSGGSLQSTSQPCGEVLHNSRDQPEMQKPFLTPTHTSSPHFLANGSDPSQPLGIPVFFPEGMNLSSINGCLSQLPDNLFLCKSASLAITPATDGYLSVKDVQNRYCNKSI